MKKFRKYLFRTLIAITGIILLLMIIVFTYVSLNKQKIIKEVTAAISKKINGNVSIGNVELSFFRNFPTISVLLHNVQVTDTMYKVYGHPFFKAEEVYAQLSIPKLFRKQAPLKGIKINKGEIYLFTDTSGYSNDYLFKQKKDSSAGPAKSASENVLKSIELNDFRIVIDDKKREKFHDLFINNLDAALDDKDDKSFLFAIRTDILVHSLAFNLDRGSFLKEKKFSGKFDMRYDKKSKQLQFDSIDVKLANQLFNLSGKFDLEGVEPQFKLSIHSKDVIYAEAKSLLPAKIGASLSIVDIKNPIDVNAFIDGPLKGGDPLIYITWQSKEAHLSSPLLDFDEAAFTGFFTNEVVKGEPRKDPNSEIVINDFKASWHGLPVHATKIEILNLSTPVLTCDLQSSFPLTNLYDLLGGGSMQFTSGDAMVDMTYKGPIEKNDNTNSFINGYIVFKNGTMLYGPRNVQLQQINATMLFKNSDVFINNFQTVVLNNKFTMQGVAKNLLTLVNTSPNNINIDWDIFTPNLNLNAFTFLLGSRKKVAVNKTKKNAMANVSSKIDSILDEGKLHVQLKANKLVYRQFEADNILANITLLPESYLLNDVSMNQAGGRLSLNGSLTSAERNNIAKLNMVVTNVDVSRMFHAFENFGQDGITDKSLEGSLSAKLTATLSLNESGKVNPSSLASTVDFSLKNGALNNYEPVKKMQRFIFKKRDFDNIRFAELKDRLDVKGGEVTINRMEIQSSVLSMFVEGTYSQKGKTDISIQVPLNNLKKRDSTYNPENLGTDIKVGKSIFLRGRPGDDGSIKFGLDLFNKYNKAKKNKE